MAQNRLMNDAKNAVIKKVVETLGFRYTENASADFFIASRVFNSPSVRYKKLHNAFEKYQEAVVAATSLENDYQRIQQAKDQLFLLINRENCRDYLFTLFVFYETLRHLEKQLQSNTIRASEPTNRILAQIKNNILELNKNNHIDLTTIILLQIKTFKEKTSAAPIAIPLSVPTVARHSNGGSVPRVMPSPASTTTVHQSASHSVGSYDNYRRPSISVSGISSIHSQLQSASPVTVSSDEVSTPPPALPRRAQPVSPGIQLPRSRTSTPVPAAVVVPQTVLPAASFPVLPAHGRFPQDESSPTPLQLMQSFFRVLKASIFSDGALAVWNAQVNYRGGKEIPGINKVVPTGVAAIAGVLNGFEETKYFKHKTNLENQMSVAKEKSEAAAGRRFLCLFSPVGRTEKSQQYYDLIKDLDLSAVTMESIENLKTKLRAIDPGLVDPVKVAAPEHRAQTVSVS